MRSQYRVRSQLGGNVILSTQFNLDDYFASLMYQIFGEMATTKEIIVNKRRNDLKLFIEF